MTETAQQQTRQAECLDCHAQIVQDNDAGIWLPLRCAGCDASIEQKGRELLKQAAEGAERVLRREMMAESNLRAEMVDGRLTIDRLPELYAETRIIGGVSPERYREIATLVKDFVSVPPLLRTSGIASVLYLHGAACSIRCKLDHRHELGKGTGKSWLAEAAIGHCATRLGMSAMFATPMELWARVKDGGAESEAQTMRNLAGLNVLAIDDLARKQTPTEWEVSVMLEIIDQRIRQSRATLITCNYDVRGIFELWTDANDPKKSRGVELLCDRLADSHAAILIPMSGKSLRRERS